MNKFTCHVLAILIIPLFLTACATLPAPEEGPLREKARQLILNGQADCVVIRDGKIITQKQGGGVMPLLLIYKYETFALHGSTVVDKVIGRAAAAILICGKVRHVHGEVMSEDAVKFLNRHGVTSSYTLLVPRILNRKRDGLCPMEQKVQGLNNPYEALLSLLSILSQ